MSKTFKIIIGLILCISVLFAVGYASREYWMRSIIIYAVSENYEFYTNPKSNTVKYIIWELSKVEKVNFKSFDTVFPAIWDKISSHRLPKIKMGFVTSDEELEFLYKKYISESIEMGSTWEFKISDCCQAIKLWVDV